MEYKTRTILIIDDTPEDRLVLQRCLALEETCRYVFTEAENGEQALALCNRANPDCVLLDYHLPDLNSLEILAAFIGETGVSAPAVVMVTSADMLEIAVEALKHGAQDYLVKERLTPEEAQRAVNNAIEKAALQRQLEAQRQVLAESEARFRTMANVVPTIVWTAAPDGTITFANDQWFHYVGITPEQNARNWPELVLHPDDIDRCVSQWTQALQLGTDYEIEVRNRRYDGEFRWFLTRAMPLRNAEGQVIAWFGTTTDIHERKLAEAALRRVNERFEIAEAAARGFVYDYIVETGEVERSSGLERVLGYREGEIPQIRGWWQQQIHPEDREQVLREWDVMAASDAGWQNLEYRVRHKDGHYLWVWDRAQLIRDAEGRLVRRIGATVDITEHKQIETEREQALAAERRQVEQLQALATAAIDLSAVNRLNTKLQIITERARTIIGAHQGATSLVVDQNWDQAINVVSLSEKYAQYQDYNMAPDGSGIHAFVCRTNRPVRLTQTELEAHPNWCGLGAEAGKHPPMRGWLAVPLVGRNGQNMGFIQLSDKYEEEFTEGDEAILIQLAHLAAEQIEHARAAEDLARSEAALRASEAQLRALNQTLEQRVIERTIELQRSMQELDQFAYVASHDLKAPLRAIEHLANWIAEDAGAVLPASSRTHLNKMQGRILRMEKLLDDLLAYSRAGRDYYKEIEVVDTHVLIEEVIDLLTPPQGFTITVQVDIPTLATRRAPLELVFRNLISNAINHHHRPEGQVHISAREAGPFVEFSVGDDGPGIDETFHERIFQMFQTLHPRDQMESSGIGLAVVKKVVESRGGTVKVISGEGQGTTFKFTWPKD